MEFHLIDFIEHILNIVVLFLMLRVFLFKPVRKFMQDREARFAREREQIDESRTQADSLKTQYELSMKNAKLEAEKLAEVKLRSAEHEADDLRRKAKQDAQVLLTDAMAQAVTERDGLLTELKSQTAELAVDIAEKILEREVKPQDHQRVIDSFFEKIG